MKRITYLITIAAAAIAIASCAASKKRNDMKHRSNILVAYFSAQGHTEAVARKIAAATHGDLFGIEPSQPYTEADLDGWNDSSRGTLEARNRTLRPGIANKVDDFAGYDTIYLGFPIWWYTAPTIINTFLESYDTDGKVIIPFATSGGSGYGATEKDLRVSAPYARFLPGRVLNGMDDKQIRAWLQSLSE